MAQSILVYSESGAGKSTSIRTLNPEETFIINIANKPLPFKGWKSKYPKATKEKPEGHMLNTSNTHQIMHILSHISNKRPDIKNIVVDDWQYMSAFEYFERADEKGFQKFVDIGKNLANTAMMPAKLRDNLHVFFLTHVEDSVDSDGHRKQKAKTIGKMVDEKLTLEGLFSIVLHAKIIKTKDGELQYVFQTNGDGTSTCKSPLGMFDDQYIPNDLQLVIESIKSYEEE